MIVIDQYDTIVATKHRWDDKAICILLPIRRKYLELDWAPSGLCTSAFEYLERGGGGGGCAHFSSSPHHALVCLGDDESDDGAMDGLVVSWQAVAVDKYSSYLFPAHTVNAACCSRIDI